MGLENVSLAAILAYGQALAMMLEDVTTGDCADCQCTVCVSMRGLSQAVSEARSQ